MPYLTADRKAHLDDGAVPVTLGDLTYRLTVRLLEHSMNFEAVEAAMREEIDHFLHGKQLSFKDYAEVLGCMVATEQEFNRQRSKIDPTIWTNAHILERVISRYYQSDVAPYEDRKLEQNGDVYA